MAIFYCLSHLTLYSPPHGRFSRLTDSLSSLHSLSNRISTNPLIQRVHLIVHSLHSIDSQITFISIPGHIGFPEHNAVDKTAKQATSSPKIIHYTRLPIADLNNHYRSLILQQWNLFRKTQSSNKLLSIKKIPSPWSSSTRDSKREELIILASLTPTYSIVCETTILVSHTNAYTRT